jgi:hypothetical protein
MAARAALAMKGTVMPEFLESKAMSRKTSPADSREHCRIALCL